MAKKSTRKKTAKKTQARKPAKRKQAKAKPKGRALVVSLTHVDPTKYNRWDGRNGCQGCGIDASRITDVLLNSGYEVIGLSDEAATAEAVLAGLKSGAAHTRAGDSFFLFFAGHGGRQPDTSGDEDDGYDETLVCWDKHLIGDELNDVWKSFRKGSKIVMLSDSCNSGTNYRSIGFRAPTPIVPVERSVAAEMAAQLLHIGGCRDGATSTGFASGGAFTTALMDSLEDHDDLSWAELHAQICQRLRTGQAPQINTYGPKAAALKKVAAFQPIPKPSATSAVPEVRAVAPNLSLAALAEGEAVFPSSALSRSAAGAREVMSVNVSELGDPGTDSFNRNVQECLSKAGVYDRLAIDGDFGAMSQWALEYFKLQHSAHHEEGIGPITARALLGADYDLAAWVQLDGSFASRIVQTMLKQGHWMCWARDCTNIIYIEGVNEHGEWNGDRPDEFNDRRVLLRFDGGKPYLEANWAATSEPGRHFTEHPMNTKGAARIALGQFYAWTVGRHRSDHEALVQRGPVKLHRDHNKDFLRDGDPIDVGSGFGINQHWGYDRPVDSIGRSSAGCLVGRSKQEHREFMSLVKRDPRPRASGGYRFTTTIIHGRDLVSRDEGGSGGGGIGGLIGKIFGRRGAPGAEVEASRSLSAEARAGSATSADEVAVNFMWRKTPKAIRDEIREQVSGDFARWFATVLKLRMDQTLWFGAGSTPGDILAGKAKVAALELMDNIDGVHHLSRKDGKSRPDVRDALTAVFKDGGKTTADLSSAISDNYSV